MKKMLLVTGMLSCMMAIGAGTVHAQATVSLDNAIQSAAQGISGNIGSGTRVAVLAMQSGSERMSNFLIDEMIARLVGAGGFTVVNRAQLELLAGELHFNMSGWVDDATAQSIGRFMGVESIITGAFEPLGNFYRFRVQVIEVETAAIRGVYIADVQHDALVAALLGDATVVPVQQAAQPRAPRAPRAPREPREGDSSWGFGLVFNNGSGSRGEADVSHSSIGGWLFTNTRLFEFSLGVLGGTVNANGGQWDEWWWEGSSPIFALHLGFNWRIPFAVNDRFSLFPALGFGLDLTSSSVMRDEWGFVDSLGFGGLRLNFGGGADFDLTEHLFIRLQLMGHYGLPFGFIVGWSSYPNMFGLTPKLGLGFRR